MAKLFANSGDPDQKLSSAASDLGLHCLPSTLLRVSQLQWVNQTAADNAFFLLFFYYYYFSLYFSEQISLVFDKYQVQ